MAYLKGKGLTPEQYERFVENENFFNNDYQAYIKSITDKRDIELAMIRRKYQSSFVSGDNYSGTFTHKLSNPDEFSEMVSREIKKSGCLNLFIQIPEDFENCGSQILILNEVDEAYKSLLEHELSQICAKFKSLFRSLKYIDSHIQKICADAITSSNEAKAAQRKLQMQMLLEKKAAQKVVISTEIKLPPEPVKLLGKVADPSHALPIKKEPEITRQAIEEPELIEENKASLDENGFSNSSFPTAFYKIEAKQLTLRNLGSATLISLSIEIQCSRCNARKLLKILPSPKALELGDTLFSEQAKCECTLLMTFEITPMIIFAKSGKKLADGKFKGCTPIDFVDMDLKFTCPDCGDPAYTPGTRCYIPYNVSCQSCFSRGTLQIDGIAFEDSKIPNDGKSALIGKALPKNGICKHFKNSFRWFKFPCCQRMFPCMICHDDQNDHQGQKGEHYICGFCGALQKITQKDLCKQCERSVNGNDGEKRFWEGGKGCRNTEKMSKNDRKKQKHRH